MIFNVTIAKKKLRLTEGSDDGYHFLAIKCFLIMVYVYIYIYTLIFRHNAIAHLIVYRTV